MHKKILTVMLCSVCCYAYADIPLTVEDLTVDKNRFKLDADISYFNQNERNLNQQGFSIIDLGNGRTISIPNAPSEGVSNTDSLIGTIGLRYGINNKLEAGIRTSSIYQQQRLSSEGINDKLSDQRLQDVSLTTQYQLVENHKKLPNSLIFSEVSIHDDTEGLKTKSGSSALIGGTVYTINDPVVLSLTGSYQYNSKRQLISYSKEFDENVDISIGDVLSVNGSVGFAVNPDITLNTGVGWQLRQSDEIDNQKLNSRQTQTNLNLGMAYAISERSNLTANVRSNISGGSGSTLSIGLTSKLGKLPDPLSKRYQQYKRNIER